MNPAFIKLINLLQDGYCYRGHINKNINNNIVTTVYLIKILENGYKKEVSIDGSGKVLWNQDFDKNNKDTE